MNSCTDLVRRTSPEKSSRDSGIITPSEGGSLTSPDQPDAVSGFERPANPEDSFAPKFGDEKPAQPVHPVKAAVVTSELDQVRCGVREDIFSTRVTE
jgi:hypothetical protein